MAGMSDYLELKLLDLVFGAVAFTGPATYVQIHIGDPGEAGTANTATGPPTRQQVTTWNAASGGTKTNSSSITFSSLAANETLTHISVWDAVSGGNCLAAGTITPNRAVTIGDSITFAAASITVTAT